MNPVCAPHFGLSVDGYVRLPEQMLANLQLVHVDSGIDETLLPDLRASAVDAVHAGYTEWQRMPPPTMSPISVAWDWYLDRASGVLLVAWGDVRSNIMGVDASGSDIGMARTADVLIHRLARLNWRSEVASAVRFPSRDLRTLNPRFQ
jgi:hypothetical protein